MNKIEKLLQRYQNAGEAVQAELSEMFPESMVVDVFLSCRQKNPTRVTVVGWMRDGHVRVRPVENENECTC